MGLAPIMAIYQARFNRYLENRGLKSPSDQKVWAFLGDGETDEPESLGALTLASREKLDNLIFVVNCNLQRLDGPVRGNGKIIQELEAVFRGAGWNVIKVIWGTRWDPLLRGGQRRPAGQADGGGRGRRVSEVRRVERRLHPQALLRQGSRLLEVGQAPTPTSNSKLRRGGHDPIKVYAAYKAAVEHKGSPTVILATDDQGLRPGRGRRRTATSPTSRRSSTKQELAELSGPASASHSRRRVQEAPFYSPPTKARRCTTCGGGVRSWAATCRTGSCRPIAQAPPESLFEEFYKGSGGRKWPRRWSLSACWPSCFKDPDIGKLHRAHRSRRGPHLRHGVVVPASGYLLRAGQLYEPVDKESLLYYKEQKDGPDSRRRDHGGRVDVLVHRRGHGLRHPRLNTIPFYFFYSIFGMQRIFDLIWTRRGHQSEGLSGRRNCRANDLAGEGLQHCDGHSHLFALAAPHLKAYDPAFGYELAVIVRDGIHRMYERQEDVYYYITMMNEFYPMPAMPEGVKEGIIKGMYRYRPATSKKTPLKVNLLGSGTILNEVVKAQELLESKYGVAADVWSVTSYKELYTDAIETERWNRLHPQEEDQKRCYLQECFRGPGRRVHRRQRLCQGAPVHDRPMGARAI